LPQAQEEKMWKRHRWSLGCGSGCLVVVALYLLMMVTNLWDLTYILNWGNLPFDQHQWKTADLDNIECIRGRMVRSLVHSHRLIGMSREEVLQLLGPPDSLDEPLARGESAMEAGNPIGYYLGMRGGFGIDPDILWLWFDRNGRVRRWHIVTS